MKTYRTIACVIPVLFLSMVTFSVSCSQKQLASDEKIPTPTPTSPISKDDKDNGVNPDGYTIPSLEAKNKVKSTRKEKQADGTVLVVRTVGYRPVERVIAHMPPHGRGSDWMITGVVELSFKSARPFCYENSTSPYITGGNAIGVTLRYRICDIDGDGVYEFKGNGFGPIEVPKWAMEGR